MKAHITPTVMDGIVVRWNVDPDNYERGEISASRNAIVVTGYHHIRTPAALDIFRATLQRADEIRHKLGKAYNYGSGPDVATVRGWLVDLGVEVVEGKGFGS